MGRVTAPLNTFVNHWIYKDKPFLKAPENFYGFIYLITNTKTNQKYIGKKIFWSQRTKKVAGKKNKKHFIKESDWAKYWSSSLDLKEIFEQYSTKFFRREILRLCPDKRSLTYSELEFQIKLDVLTAKLPNGEYEFYNRNIMARFFRSTMQS